MITSLKKKAEEQYKAKVDLMKKTLSEWPLDNPDKVLQYPEKLREAEDLSKEKPRAPIHPIRFLENVKRNPHPECKEAYWRILQRKPYDENKYKVETFIAGAFGEAYGKVMSEDDVDIVNQFCQRYKEFKDPDIRRHLLEMAPRFGITNLPAPVWPD